MTKVRDTDEDHGSAGDRSANVTNDRVPPNGSKNLRALLSAGAAMVMAMGAAVLIEGAKSVDPCNLPAKTAIGRAEERLSSSDPQSARQAGEVAVSLGPGCAMAHEVTAAALAAMMHGARNADKEAYRQQGIKEVAHAYRLGDHSDRLMGLVNTFMQTTSTG